MPDTLLNDQQNITPQVPVVNENLSLPETSNPGNPFEQFNGGGFGNTRPTTPTTIGGNTEGLSDLANQMFNKQAADPYNQAKQFETPDAPGRAAAENSDYFEKLGGVRPGMDVEEQYGQSQTAWNKLKNAVTGAGALAANQFVEQLTSWGDTADLFTSNPVFKQAEMEEINKWQEDFNNKYHIFQTQEDRNSFFNTSNFANMIQQSGYAIGAVLEIAAEEALMSALTTATFGATSELQAARTIQLAGRLGKVATRTRELEKTLQGTSALRKIFNSGVGRFVNPLQDLTSFALDFNKLRRADQIASAGNAGLRTAARGFGAFYRDMRMLNAGITEAKAEAAGVMKDTYAGLVDDYTKTHGVAPQGEEDQKLKDAAYAAAQQDGAVQAVWIALSDRVAFDGVLKNFKAARFLDDGLASKGIYRNTAKAIKAGGDEYVAKTGIKGFMHGIKTSPVKSLLKVPLTYAKSNLMEGVQETGQDIVNEATKNYFVQKYGTSDDRQKQKSSSDLLRDAAGKQMTMEGMKTFMSGFLTGGILNMGGHLMRGGQNVASRLSNKEGFADTQSRADAQRNSTVAQMNSIVADKNSFYNNLLRANSAMTEAAKSGDKKTFWDAHDDASKTFVMNLVKTGMTDVAIDRLEEAAKELDVKEFRAAYKDAVPESMNDEQAKTHIQNLVRDFKSKTEVVKNTYESIRDSYGNPFNPSRFDKNSEEYITEVANYHAHNEAVEHIAFAKQTHLDIAKRQGEVLNATKGLFPNTGMTTLQQMTNPFDPTMDKEIELIKEDMKNQLDAGIKADGQKKLDNYTNYRTALKKFLSDMNEAGNDRDLQLLIREDFVKNHESVMRDILSERGQNTIDVETFHKGVNSILDYVELQGDHNLAVAYFNTVANPFGFDSFVQAHYRELMKMVQQHQKESKPQESVKITLRDKEGKEYEIDLTTGEEYITEAEPSVRVSPNNKKNLVRVWDQDIFEIVSFDKDNNTVTLKINDGEPTVMGIDEFALKAGRLFKLSDMTDAQKLYFRNRNMKFKISVYNKTGLPHADNPKYTKTAQINNGTWVDARLDLVQENKEWVVKMVYKNPTNGKTESVPFSIGYYKKFVSRDKTGKAAHDLRLGNTPEAQYEQDYNTRLTSLFNKQLDILNFQMEEQIKKVKFREKRRDEIRKELNSIYTELQKLELLAPTAQEMLETLKGEKSKKATQYRKEAKEILTTLPKLKELAAKLEAERSDIEKELDAANQLIDLYYNAAGEIIDNNRAFIARPGETIATDAEEAVKKAQESRFASYVPADRISDVIAEIQSEKDTIDAELKIVYDVISELEKIMGRFLKYEDILNVLADVDVKSGRSLKDLQTTLYRMRIAEKAKTEPDTEKIEVLGAMLSGLNREKSPASTIFKKDALDAIMLSRELLGAQKRMSDLLERGAQLQDKIDEFTAASEQDKEISRLQDRVEFLNKVSEGLIQGQRNLNAVNSIITTSTSVTAATKEEAIQIAEYGGIMSTGPIESGYSIEGISIKDWDKPQLDDGGLFKSAGVHFLRGNNQEANNEAVDPSADRFFTFTSEVRLDDSYRLLPVSKHNDPFGIAGFYIDQSGNTVTVEDDIKLIVCKKSNGKLAPVDIDGKVLAEPTRDNIVYTSMVNDDVITKGTDTEVLEYFKSDKAPFTIRTGYTGEGDARVPVNMSDAEILGEVKKYREFKAGILKNTQDKVDQELKITGKSNGKQRREPLDSTTGAPQELALEGRLIKENPDFRNLKHPDGSLIELVVSTSENSISKTIKPGRLVITKGGNYYQVYNRQITTEEKENIYNVLKAILPMFGRKYVTEQRKKELAELYTKGIITTERLAELTTSLTKEEQDQFDMGMRYLMGVLYMKQPKEGETIGKNQFYISKHSIFFGEKSYQFEIDGALNVSALDQFKDEILAGAYHSVNNMMIEKKNIPFISVTTENGKIVQDKKHTNYLEYLFTSSDTRKPVVYTNIKPYVPGEPQLANVYLRYEGAKETPGPIIQTTTTTAAPTTTSTTTSNDTYQFTDLPKDKPVVFTIRRKDGSKAYLHSAWSKDRFVINKVTTEAGGELDVNSPAVQSLQDDFIKELVDTLDGYRTDGGKIPVELASLAKGVIDIYNKKGILSVSASVPSTTTQTAKSPVVSTTIDSKEIEAKKADIEKRREEEFMDIDYTMSDELSEDRAFKEYTYNVEDIDGEDGKEGRKNVLLIEKDSDADTWFEIEEVIKYHAAGTGFKEISPVYLKFLKELKTNYDAINAKYDAELAALTKSNAKTVKTSGDSRIVKLNEPGPGGETHGVSWKGRSVYFNSEAEAAQFIKDTVDLPEPSQMSDEEVKKAFGGIKAAPRKNRDSSYRLPSVNDNTEDIQEFKKWMSSRLPQVGVEISNSLIDGRAWGQFMGGVIKLYENAGKGTGYHEAFEAVWNTYLTDAQQDALVKEYQSRSDYKSLPEYQWAVSNYPELTEAQQIKEALAEEFIDYVRSDNGIVKTESPKRNSFFRALSKLVKLITDLIKRIFNVGDVNSSNVTQAAEDVRISQIFSKIARGGFSNAKPVRQGEGGYRNSLTGTSLEFSQKLMEGMSGYFFMKLYENNNNIKSLFDKSTPGLFNEIYSQVAEEVKQTFLEDREYNIADYMKKGVPVAQAERIVDNDIQMKYRAATILRMDGEVKQLFKQYLSQFGFQFKNQPVEGVNAQQTDEKPTEAADEQYQDMITNKDMESTDRLGIVEVMYVDPRNMTKSEVRLLIASLTADQYKSDSSATVQQFNELNLPVLEDFGRKQNILLNELHSVVPMKRWNPETKQLEEHSVIDQMFEKLDTRFKKDGKYKSGYEWIARLKRRLGLEQPSGEKVDISTLNADAINLLVAFETSFSNNRNIPHKIIVGPEGNIFSDNTVDATNSRRIREEWENNIKHSAKVFNGDFTKGPLLYIDNKGILTINNQSPVIKEMENFVSGHDILSNMRKLGFDFTPTDDEIVATVGTTDLRKAYKPILDKIKDGTIKTFGDLFGRQIVNGRINFFVSIESQFTADETVLSARNAEGKQQYSITLPSAVSYLMNSLKAADNLRDFIASNPQLGSVNPETGQVTLNAYAQNSAVLRPGGLVFDRDGKKYPNAKPEYRYILGMASLTEPTGTSTDRLDFQDKIVQEIYHLLDGTYYTVINSDKSSEFGLHLGHFVKYNELRFDVKNNYEVLDLYKNALADEISAAMYESKRKNFEIKHFSENVTKLGHFQEILKLDKNKPLDTMYKSVLAGKMSIQDFTNNSEVVNAISTYITTQVAEHEKWLFSLGFINRTVDTEFGGFVQTDIFSAEKLREVTGDTVKYSNGNLLTDDFHKLVMFMVVNRQLAVFEQHKLLFGHPQLYKDLAKRSSGINSQKQVMSENSSYLEWLDKNMPRFDGKSKRTNTFKFTSNIDPEMVSRYYKDVAEGIYASMVLRFNGNVPAKEKKSIEQTIGAYFNDNGTVKSIFAKTKGTLMDAYYNANEPDGGAYIMPDFFRDMHFLSGKFNKEQSDLLEYENALEILDRSDSNHPLAGTPGFSKTYTKLQLQEAEFIKSFGAPKAVLQVLKPQGFGYQTTTGLTHTTFLKHSVVPLTWSRVVNNPSMLSKYIQAQEDNVDIIGFESGQKVGLVTKSSNRTIQPLYDNNGALNLEKVPVQEMYTKYYGFQVEMADYTKDKVIFGSQMRKINLTNLPEHLKPAAKEYNDLLESITQIEYRSLLKDLGIREENGTYVTDDLKGMIDTLREEISRRDMPDNVVDMLEVEIDEILGERLKYRFDASPVREKLDNILNALVDSRIISQKMFGKASVQVPATMFEQSNRKFTYLDENGLYAEPVDASELTEEQQKTKRLVSSDLNFYKNVDGKITSMDVYVPWYFEGLSPKEAGFKLENGIWIPTDKVDPKLLKAIGFRIPTQGMNSIESINIKGFLDPDSGWGDMIVVPTEIVAKSGSDFDIDKMNLFFKNYKVNDGKLDHITWKGNIESHKDEKTAKKAMQNRLIDLMDTILTDPSNYRQLVTPNGTQTLKPLAEEIRELKKAGGAENSKTSLSEWKNMAEVRERYITGKKLVGVIALQITSHTLSQYGNVELTGSYKDADGVIQPVNINLDTKSQDGKFILNLIEDNNYQLISELLSESMTGAVDAAKDPFIFDLNLTLDTASTWFYLQKLGVPVRDIAYLHVQPAIENYFKRTSQNKSVTNTVNDKTLKSAAVKLLATAEIIKRAYPKQFEDIDIAAIAMNSSTPKWGQYMTVHGMEWGDVNDIAMKSLAGRVEKLISEIPGKKHNASTLSKMVKPVSEMTQQEALDQLRILKDYIAYQQQGRAFSNYIQAISYDTSRTKNINENNLQKARYDKVKEEGFIQPESLDRVIETTFLKSIKSIKDRVPEMFQNFFVTLHPKSRPVMKYALDVINDPKVFMTQDDAVELLNRFQNFYLTYLLHTVKTKVGNKEISLNTRYEDMFFGENSVAKRLKEAQGEYPDNKALKSLFGIINNDTHDTDNIKLYGSRMNTYEINSFGESLEQLNQTAIETGDIGLSELVRDLSIFAVLQSGVQQSPITFTKVLPISLYSTMIGDIFDNYLADDSQQVDPALVWRQFYQNNYKNGKLIDIKANYGSIPTGNSLISGFKSKPEYAAVRYYTPEAAASKDVRDKLRKEKKWDELFEYVLYERIKVLDSTGFDLSLNEEQPKYRPINKLGNGMYLTEVSTSSITSLIEKNGKIDEGKYADAVKEYIQKVRAKYYTPTAPKGTTGEKDYYFPGDMIEIKGVSYDASIVNSRLLDTLDLTDQEKGDILNKVCPF